MAGQELLDKVCELVKAEPVGSGFVGFCPAHNDLKKRSLSIWLNDDDTVGVKCYAGCRKAEVFQALGNLGVEGLSKAKVSKKTDDKERDKVSGAAGLWDTGKDAKGTAAELYLNSRGITRWPPAAVAYGRDGQLHWLMNPILDHEAKLQGVQRLYITESGVKADHDPSRRINGTRRGGGTILPGTEPTVLCEGLETGLSIWQATGYQVVCTLGLANLDKLPLGSGMKIIVARDLDPHTSKATKQLWNAIRQLRQRSVNVRVATPAKYDGLKKSDFNDVLQREGEAKVKELIDAADEQDDGVPASHYHKDLMDPIEGIKQLSGRYFVAKDAGKTLVFEAKRDFVLDRNVLIRMTFTDFRNYYLNKEVNLGINVRPEPLGEYWLKSPARSQFDHIVFQPAGHDPQDYNLWQGYAFHSEPGPWDLLHAHIRDVLCGGRKDLYDYLLGWLARGVQRLDDPGQVAVVLRGKRGTGKGTLANAYGKLFGQHFLPVAHARHVTGNFNSHLRDCLFLFADEAFWAGDKQGESVIKSLVTEPTLTIEAKGRDIIPEKNRVKLMIASNSSWVVPAGMEERRFLVIDVPDVRMQDTEYFTKIVEQLESGDGQGYSGFLYDLLQYDLSTFNVFKVPQTAALLDQKLSSMLPHEKWWYERLQEGVLDPGQSHWQDPLGATTLHQAYLQWTKSLGINRPLPQVDLLRHLEPLLPEKWKRVRLRGAGRPWGFQLPALTACRQQMDLLLRQASQWDHEVEEQAGTQEAEDDIPF